ncbi:MAG: succinylglutamate desuccinylase/aspartoacylase family protein [Gammaproteobacteria bacterium]|jgi:predicted deacylase|nr:succinylglutamate desuccinylase/aspartoacylase family protein [Gammaproteobacteria bacterium]
MKQPISINGISVMPGEVARIQVPVADLYTSTSLYMPVQVVRGRRPGPIILVSAAVHGDELNGVEIIRRLLKRKLLRSIRGTLIAVPIVNVHGFLNQSRYLPDRRDLNRSFPGSSKGSIASRMAHIFMNELVAKANYGIDLHTGAINRSNLPQIRGNLDDPTTLELARAFGTPVIINSNIRDGSLRASASDHGIPMLIYEAGEALRFDEVSIRAGVRGVFNVMRHIEMLPQTKRKQAAAPMLARSTSWVRAPASGIIGAQARLGSSVSEGQPLAIISDPLGDTQEAALAPFDGIVIGRNNLPLAHEGDALFNIAAFRSVAVAETRVEKFVAEHDPDAMSYDD